MADHKLLSEPAEAFYIAVEMAVVNHVWGQLRHEQVRHFRGVGGGANQPLRLPYSLREVRRGHIDLPPACSRSSARV